MTDNIDWDKLSYVISSSYRVDVMTALRDGPGSPTTVSERSGPSVSNVSRALRELGEEDLVELLVSETRQKGRIYGLTDQGEAIIERAVEDGLVTHADDD